MAKRHKYPVALTIAGSDSGGGAGIQADLNTFAALGVHGTSAITAVTAQNPRAVLGIQACRPEIVRRQLEAVFAELPPRACKTGMLFNAAIIRAVAEFFRRQPHPALVVDPVMIATSGANLLRSAALEALKDQLLPLAALVTPNLPETELLLGSKIQSEEDMRQAADIFFDGRTELLLTAPLIRGLSLHGTGCAYSAAITGYLALGRALAEAVSLAKEYITQAIAHSRLVNGHRVLNWSWQRR